MFALGLYPSLLPTLRSNSCGIGGRGGGVSGSNAENGDPEVLVLISNLILNVMLCKLEVIRTSRKVINW